MWFPELDTSFLYSVGLRAMAGENPTHMFIYLPQSRSEYMGLLHSTLFRSRILEYSLLSNKRHGGKTDSNNRHGGNFLPKLKYFANTEATNYIKKTK